jgi:hypothetical protein
VSFNKKNDSFKKSDRTYSFDMFTLFVLTCFDFFYIKILVDSFFFRIKTTYMNLFLLWFWICFTVITPPFHFFLVYMPWRVIALF